MSEDCQHALTFGRWWWETEEPLKFRDHWFKAMLDSPDLRSTQTLKLELETLDYKVVQLTPIVERLKRLESREFETHIIDGKPTTTRFVLAGEGEVETWTGPANLDGREYHPYRGKTSLNYHVVTLTWHLRFPAFPRAHIPTLRRAPRMPRDCPSAPHSSNLYEDPLPERQHGRAPTEMPRMTRAMRRRLAKGEIVYGASADERARRYDRTRSILCYLLEQQKWQGDCWIVGQRNGFSALGTELEKEKWERLWREQGGLLKFE